MKPAIGSMMAYDPVTNKWGLGLRARGLVLLGPAAGLAAGDTVADGGRGDARSAEHGFKDLADPDPFLGRGYVMLLYFQRIDDLFVQIQNVARVAAGVGT